MSALLTTVGIVLFALLIAASIALHEVGHLLPAKLFGVRVSQYMIGFGPRVWSKQKGETEYGLKAVPLGGYIRMIGMFPPAKDTPDGQLRVASTGRFALLVEDARKQTLEELQPGDEDRVFYKLPVRKRMAIMLGGPTMNLLLAFVLFTLVFVGIGIGQATTIVADVVPCTPTATNLSGATNAAGSCPTGSGPSGAASAGLQPGDTIVAVGGRPVDGWESMTGAISAAGAGPTTITVDRAGQQVALPADLTTVPRPVIDENGKATGAVQQRPFLGVGPTYETVRQPLSTVPGQMWSITTASVKALIGLPVRLYELAGTLISGGERDPMGPVSVVGVSRLGGEVAASQETLQSKASTFLALAASLNLFLFLFNLLPVLPLDGGHVAGATWEAVRRKAAAWRGRPDPGPVDVARLLPVAYAVSILLIGMSLIVIYADFVKPITLGG